MLPEKSLSTEKQKTRSLIDNLDAGQEKLIKDIELLRAKYKLLTGNPALKPVSISTANVKYHSISAAALLKNRFAGNLRDDYFERSRKEFLKVLTIMSGVLLVVSLGWLFISRTNFLTNGDFIYNTGLFGGILMLGAMIYAVTKRISLLKRLTGKDQWYYFHLLCGTAGPLLIVFHTTFNIKSVNSAVAFASMLVIVFSGIFGRFFYTQLGSYMHNAYQRLAYAEKGLSQFLKHINCNISYQIRNQLSSVVTRGMKPPDHWLQYPVYLSSLVYTTAITYTTTRKNIVNIIQGVSVLADWEPPAISGNQHRISELLKTYLGCFLGLTIASALQAAISHWRLLHVPLLFLLIITSTVHIIAVHMY